MMSAFERAKDLRSFLHRVDSFTDGQVGVVKVDWDLLSYVILSIKPNAGPYRGGEYRFQFWLGSYEVTPVWMILHPNIESHNVCVEVEDDSAPTLEGTVLSVLYIMHNPDYDDAVPYPIELTENWYRSIRVTLTGRQLGRYQGPRFIDDDDEIKGFLKEIKEEEEKRSAAEAEAENSHDETIQGDGDRDITSLSGNESFNSNEEQGFTETQAPTSETDVYLRDSHSVIKTQAEWVDKESLLEKIEDQINQCIRVERESKLIAKE